MRTYPLIDYNRVFGRIPEIMRLDLTLRNNVWEGRYYINGEPHRYRRDKLKVKLHNGIFVYEQGGESMPLVRWLVEYGGCKDYGEAFRVIRGCDLRSEGFRYEPREERVVYVSQGDFEAMRGFPVEGCPLFRWMSGLFGPDRARAAWDRYDVMCDGAGNAVFWYVDALGRICHDKRIPYLDDGRRNRLYGAFRKYLTGDGYRGRCLFGERLAAGVPAGEDVYVCESEKDALIVYMVTGRTALATGGKNGLRGTAPGMVLLPDVDAAAEWEAKAGDTCRVLRWWEKYPGYGGHDGVGDYLVWWWKRKLKKS